MPNVSRAEQARMMQEERRAKIFNLALECPAVTCPTCLGTVFNRGITIREIPKERINLLNLGVVSKNVITEIPTLYCVKCGTTLVAPSGGAHLTTPNENK